MKYIVILLFLFFFVGLEAQNTNIGIYYKSHIDKHFESYGIDFYGFLLSSEGSLEEIGLLKGNTRSDYFSLIDNILSKKIKENQIKKVKNSILKSSIIDFAYNYFFMGVSIIDKDSVNDENVCLNMYKLNFRESDSKEQVRFVENVFISTNFNDEIERMNLLYILLLEIDKL
jgi:hypothetical protein